MTKYEQILQGKQILPIKNQFAQYISVSLTEQSAITSKIRNLDQEAAQSRETVSEIISTLAKMTSDLDKKTLAIPLLSKLTQMRADLAQLSYGKLPELYYQDRQLLADLRDAQIGILRQTLIPRHILQKAYIIARANLVEWAPNYEIMNTNYHDMYLDNRVKINVIAEGANIQLPLELIKKQSPIFNLYKNENIPVPMKETNLSLASKVDPEEKYLAVSDQYYTTLTDQQLIACHRIPSQNVTFCPTTLPLLKHEHESCLMSLYKTDEPEVIYKSCPVTINKLTHFGPRVLETKDRLLISGMSDSHQMLCEFDNQPQQLNLIRYSSILKSNLCRCNIISENYFLKGYLCERKAPKDVKIEINHPENQLASKIIFDIQQSINQFEFVPEDYQNASNALALAINDLTKIGKNRNDMDDLHVSEVKRQILQQIEQEILIEEQQQPKAIDTSEWFTGELWLLGLSFICSLVGTLSCVCYCYTLIKHKQVASVVTAGLLSQTSKSYAYSDCDPNESDEHNLKFIHLLVQAVCTLVLAIIIFITIQSLRRFYNYYLNAGIPRLNQELELGYPRICLVLEIKSGTERVLLKMACINGFVDEIFFIGTLKTRIIGFTGSYCGGALAVNFGSETISRLRVGQLTAPLPDSITVPWFLIWKTKRISQARHKTRILKIDDYNIAHILTDTTTADTYPLSEIQRLI